MTPDPITNQSLRSGLDRLARTGDRHMRGCGVPAARRTRAAALALFDRQLQLHDRLVTADEFIEGDRHHGFIDAAVEDATEYVAGAEQTALERIGSEKPRRSRRLKWAIAATTAVLLLGVLFWLLNRGTRPASDRTAPSTLTITPDLKMKSSVVDGRGHDGTKRTELRAIDKAARTGAGGSPAAISPERAEVNPSKASLSKGGQTAPAKPSKASSSSNGSPSDKASPNEGKSDEKASEQSSRASSDTPGSGSEPMSEPRQRATSMSGNESDKDSSANQEQAAGANNQSSQSSSRADAQSESQENKEGQKGPSGSPGQQQPSKSGQKGEGQSQSANPGASSNSSQGKGQGNSKDALKKSRGVASMILGVPIPDRVRGLPNPGLVRTIQEKTVPKEEHVFAVNAESRGERQNPIGPLEHPQLRPWQKDLVRDYFSQESSTEGKP